MKKTIITVFISLSLVLTLTTCKKAKLTGDYSNLVGTWHRTSGWADEGNINFKMELLESGNYELFNGDERIDNGYLKTDDQRFIIISNKFQKHQYKYYDKKYLHQNNDTTFTIRCDYGVFDGLTSLYIKEK